MITILIWFDSWRNDIEVDGAQSYEPRYYFASLIISTLNRTNFSANTHHDGNGDFWLKIIQVAWNSDVVIYMAMKWNHEWNNLRWNFDRNHIR